MIRDSVSKFGKLILTSESTNLKPRIGFIIFRPKHVRQYISIIKINHVKFAGLILSLYQARVLVAFGSC
jgi:hypothetical protein